MRFCVNFRPITEFETPDSLDVEFLTSTSCSCTGEGEVDSEDVLFESIVDSPTTVVMFELDIDGSSVVVSFELATVVPLNADGRVVMVNGVVASAA